MTEGKVGSKSEAKPIKVGISKDGRPRTNSDTASGDQTGPILNSSQNNPIL
jgi:hypothetical protein